MARRDTPLGKHAAPSQAAPALLSRRWLGLCCAAALLAPPVGAQTGAPPELASALPGARQRGQATMRFLGLRIYDITLWSPAPVRDALAEPPLALVLVYGRTLSGQRIAERSIDEMRGIGSFSPAQADTWLAEMARLFPDVQANDRLTGIHQSDGTARFYFNGQLRGQVSDPLFARLFFGIWLSPRSSEPDLRQRLLGGA